MEGTDEGWRTRWREEEEQVARCSVFSICGFPQFEIDFFSLSDRTEPTADGDDNSSKKERGQRRRKEYEGGGPGEVYARLLPLKTKLNLLRDQQHNSNIPLPPFPLWDCRDRINRNEYSTGSVDDGGGIMQCSTTAQYNAMQWNTIQRNVQKLQLQQQQQLNVICAFLWLSMKAHQWDWFCHRPFPLCPTDSNKLNDAYDMRLMIQSQIHKKEVLILNLRRWSRLHVYKYTSNLRVEGGREIGREIWGDDDDDDDDVIINLPAMKKKKKDVLPWPLP